MASERERLRAPLPRDSPVQGILTYRKRTKSGKSCYCIYSPDDSLIIAAQETALKSAYYKISISSLVFRRSSSEYIGTLYHTEGSPCCNMVIPSGSSRIPTEILRVSFQRRRSAAGVEIALAWRLLSDTSLFDESEDYEKVCQDDPESIPALLPGDGRAPSPQDQVFTHSGLPCLVLGRLHDDEWHFFVAHPLSVFVGFGIALAILRKIAKS
jgi:hypothetical protein